MVLVHWLPQLGITTTLAVFYSLFCKAPSGSNY